MQSVSAEANNTALLRFFGWQAVAGTARPRYGFTLNCTYLYHSDSPPKPNTYAAEDHRAPRDFANGYLQQNAILDLPLRQRARAPHAYFAAPVRGRRAA